MDERVVDPHTGDRQRERFRRKLESSAGKLIVIAGISLVFPGLGALTGLFSLYSAWWCVRRARALEVPKAVSRGWLALGLSVVALGVQALWVWLYVSQQG
jgi:hypothetical protein